MAALRLAMAPCRGCPRFRLGTYTFVGAFSRNRSLFECWGVLDCERPRKLKHAARGGGATVRTIRVLRLGLRGLGSWRTG